MFNNRYQTLSKAERRAFWVVIVMAVFFAAFASTVLDTLINAPNPQYALANAVPFILSLVAIISAGLIRGGRALAGARLIQIGTLVVLLINVTQAEGFAFPSAFIILAVTLYVPVQLQQGRDASTALWIGIAGAISAIILDALWAGSRVPALEQDVVTANILSIVLFIILTSTTLAQFNVYPFRTKLILLFAAIAAFSVSAIAIFINLQSRSQITQLVGQNQQTLAKRLAFETGKELESQVENLQAASGQFERVALRQSSLYDGENDQIVDSIIAFDKIWSAAPDTSPLIRGTLNNSTSNDLRKIQKSFPNHVEIFLTDKYGALIGATNRTSDYYQADEDWWKITYSLGKGKIFISQPEFDESSNTYAVLMGIPIFYNGKAVGILRSTYDVTALVENLQQGMSVDDAKIDLRLAGDVLLGGETLVQEELPGLTSVMENFGEITYQSESSLVSQQRVFSSANNIAENAVSDLGWSIIVHKDVADALQPVTEQSRTITLTALIITVLVGVLGLYASQRLAAPILTLTEVTQRLASGDLSIRAQISTQDEIGALANSFNRMTIQLQDTLGGLERRVAERTADLEFSRLVSERRAQELQIISEVSRTISTEQRLEILLPIVTRLVSDRFEFYHVGIFFIDETRQFAVLQAANSEGGRNMLARGHRLDVGSGIVGTVAQTGKARIALDVGSDATFFDNPDLPETRSEMALPFNFRGETIGVLDVQSVKPGAFTEGDANTLGILADQVAIAIENARLFGQTQQAREESEVLYNQFLRTEWKTFLQQGTSVGYRQSMVGGKPLKQPVETDEIRAALNEGKVVVIDKQDPKSLPSVAIPVQLRGQTIGVINIKAPTKNRVWSQDEINLAQAVSDRLALALDGARLLQDSQRRAAKEAKIGEMTAKIGASINMRNVLQTAVEELGRALPGSEVVIQFESEKK